MQKLSKFGCPSRAKGEVSPMLLNIGWQMRVVRHAKRGPTTTTTSTSPFQLLHAKKSEAAAVAS